MRLGHFVDDALKTGRINISTTMNKYKHNLIDLDVKKLFVEHKIDEIVEIEKILDAEIERKRTELRSMVG